VASPATVTGRHVSRVGTVNAAMVAPNQPSAPTPMTGHTSSSPTGSDGGWGVSGGSADIEMKILGAIKRPEEDSRLDDVKVRSTVVTFAL
jgi:hypothetical protein